MTDDVDEADRSVELNTTASKLADLRKRTAETICPVGSGAIDRIHANGRMTARERVLALLDRGSFVELDALATHRSTKFGLADRHPPGDGVVSGYGTIAGRRACVFSQDATVFGGTIGEVSGQKIIKIQDLAIKSGCPLIGINDGGGARIQEGVVSLGVYGDIFQRNISASGVIPQISLIMGPAAGGHAYSPAMTDFVIMIEQTSQMFITGPQIIKRITGEEVTAEELGGASTHMAKSGLAHYVAPSELDALNFTRDLLSFLPSNNFTNPPRYPGRGLDGAIEENITYEDLELDTLIPDAADEPYDMNEIIRRLLDDDLLETQDGYAPNIIVGFGRIDGRSVGVVANQPMHFAGCLDTNAAEKAARFIRTCDCFNVPILTLLDVPGFLPGLEQEYSGIIRRGAKLVYAYGEATVPKVTVVIRKNFGGAYAMGAKQLGADFNLAWPTAQIAVMGAAGAVQFVYRKQLHEHARNGEDVRELLLTLQQDYEDELVNYDAAAENGYLDAVIPPSHTRGYIAAALRLLERKIAQVPPKKHGNIPL